MAGLYLTNFLGVVNTQFDAIVQKIPEFGFFEYILLDLVILFIGYKLLFGNRKIGKGIRGRVVDLTLLNDIEKGFNGIQENIGVSKPKVPQVNYGGINVMKKVEGLVEKVRELQEMSSEFQADVIDVHIQVFKVLKGDEGGNFLQLPERELVEPDSALPPLEENEEGLI